MNAAKKVILIVDDVADDRLVAKMILQKEGFEVLEAKNWYEALLVIKTKDLSLVLLDLRMPEMGGLELLGKIRGEENISNSKSLPVIIYSSSPNCGDDYKSNGSNGYIKKYSDPKYFITKVKEALGE